MAAAGFGVALMATAAVLSGPRLEKSPAPDAGEANCRCVKNSRTGKFTKICRVPKSPKHRSGVVIRGNCR